MSEEQQHELDTAAQAASDETAAAEAHAADAAFNAGFNEVRGTHTEDDTSTKAADTDTGANGATTDGQAASGSGEGSTDTGAAADAASPQFLTLDQAQGLVNDALAAERARYDNELRKLNGRFGGLKGHVDELAKRGLTKKSLTALGEQYEDIATLIGKDLPDELPPLPALETDDDATAPGADASGAATGGDQPQWTEAMADAVLNAAIPDWQDKLRDKALDEWIKTVPETDARAFAEAIDPTVVINGLRSFDAWKVKQAERDRAEAARRANLERAAPPTTGRNAGTTTTEDDNAAFEAGFSNVRPAAAGRR